MSGWIRLHRKLRNSSIWDDKPFDRARAWVDLLMMTNYENSTLRIKSQVIEIPRGSVAFSTQKMADKWGWSRGKVNRFVNELKMEQMVVQQTVQALTVLSVCNYDEYNPLPERDGTAVKHQNGTAGGNQNGTHLRSKEVKKERKTDTSVASQTDKRKPEILDWETEQKIIALYHRHLPELTNVIVSRWKNSKHSKALKARWKESPRFRNSEFWENFFDTVRLNGWWMGEVQPNGSSWNGCKLSWLVTDSHFGEVLELGEFPDEETEAA